MDSSPLSSPARAPYATDPNHSRGRAHPEAESQTRSPFQRDRDRIIHAVAFRRLKQKTQVFVAHEGDHHRTRLTHSLEVAQIARTLARYFQVDEDLTEALALAHDLGHPPFGHAGEEELAACMADFGGFDHNVQTFRILTKLEARYPEFDGLNLTWETLEGIVKHNGPVGTPVPESYQKYCALQDLELQTFASLEAQIAALSDDIAYNNHDIDDGLRAGLFSADELCQDVPFVAETFKAVQDQYPGLDAERVQFEVIRRLIGRMVSDCIQETRTRLDDLAPTSVQQIRGHHETLVAFSEDMREDMAILRAFLFDRMYRHTEINRKMSQARRMVRALFDLFLDEPDVLPDPWRSKAEQPHTAHTARLVCDYIAGMTDSYALAEHRRLFNLDQSV